MIENSDEVTMVADGTKFGKNASYKVCSWDVVDQVITDGCIPAEYLDFFEGQQIKAQVVTTAQPECEEP